MPWLKSWYKQSIRHAAGDHLPGTPYLEEAPQGLLTWPKLLRISIPILASMTAVAWWNELLIEWGVFLTVALVISFIIRR